MENKFISRQLKLLGQLMDLNQENQFKIRSVSNAAFKVDKLPFPLAKKSISEIEQIDGLGKSIAAKIWELLSTQRLRELENLLSATPPGIVEMLSIKGLGPKKILSIWKDLGIDNIGELYYACNENRLVEAKGFGIKTQEEIKTSIEFKMANSGRFLYAKVEQFAEDLLSQLKIFFNTEHVELVGAYRRRNEILGGIDVLAAVKKDLLFNFIHSFEELKIVEDKDEKLEVDHSSGIRIYFSLCDETVYFTRLFELTGAAEHIEAISNRIDLQQNFQSEEAIYQAAKMQYIEPELREGEDEIKLAEVGNLPNLIIFDDLKGSLHNHSTWSDGINSIEEMALFCRDELKLEYLGMADHSKTAIYAKGLYENRIIAQHKEIDALNIKLAPFRIFKGIESDILSDGSLDYEEDVLKTFDFIVASVHSGFKMDEERATARLIKAIENPYTTILGHPTGRLLLSRSGYPINHKKIIDACAANNVVMEINANPLRLDMDWRYHRYAIEKGVLLSINPDAHSKNGFYDMHFGVLAARKGMVAKENCFNCFSLKQITEYLNKKRS